MPTYGKTGTGASWIFIENRYAARAITLSATETATKMSAYLRSQGSATNGWKMALADTTDDSLDYESSNMSGFTDTTGAWRDATFTSSVVADTYWLMVAGETIAGGENTIEVAYDSVSSDPTNYQYWFYTGTWPTFQNPVPSADDATGSGTHDVSIYLETAAGGTGRLVNGCLVNGLLTGYLA